MSFMIGIESSNNWPLKLNGHRVRSQSSSEGKPKEKVMLCTIILSSVK